MGVIYKKPAAKVLAKMPQKTAAQIDEKLRALAAGSANPNLDVKALKDAEGGYRLRQGDWRVLFHREGGDLIVAKIRSRGDVYK